MQKPLPLVHSKQNVTRVLALFHLSVVLSSESFPSLVTDWKQLFDRHPIARRLIFVFANHLCPTTFAIPDFQIFLTVFHVSCLVSKALLSKRRNHCSHASCDETCSPSASRSNRYDSAAISSNENKKINAVPQCSLFCINFDIWNITKQHCAHTFLIYHSCASDTCWWHNKMVQYQIFIAQTALVHHLLSEISISYLYIWYITLLMRHDICAYYLWQEL